jgi:hypothetical protein
MFMDHKAMRLKWEAGIAAALSPLRRDDTGRGRHGRAGIDVGRVDTLLVQGVSRRFFSSLLTLAALLVALLPAPARAASGFDPELSDTPVAQGAVRLTPPDVSAAAVTPIVSWANGLYVTARISQTDTPLQARAGDYGSWEKYSIVGEPSGYWVIQSAENGRFVTARVSQTDAPLQARATSIGGWEKFSIPYL